MQMNFTARPAFSPHAPFAAIKKAHTPRAARWFGSLLLLLFLAAPVVLLWVPWQQTVQGRGQVVAFDPTERKQVVTALVSGQVKKWYVVEGSRVKVGDPIVDIDDNDPGLEKRLLSQRRFLEDRLKAAEGEVRQQSGVVKAQNDVLEAAVKAATLNVKVAEQQVEVAKERKKNADFVVGFEKLRLQLANRLFKDGLGLEAQINVQEAQMRFDRAGTDAKAAVEQIKAAEATVETNKAQVLQARATALTAIATAEANLHRAEQNRDGVKQSIEELDIRIQRFGARFVKSPVNGIVFRISANAGSGGQAVKEGDELAVIVPDTDHPVVELMIDGLDAPLVFAHMEQTGRGPHVRLQFEGWPAVQFAGWPSVAVGTFGGRIRQIDPTDDGAGRFRVLVEPEKMFEGDEWPEGLFLRQGNAAIGWVFLNRVTVGFELWRQLNGFPPVIAPRAPEKSGKDEKKNGAKPPKIKAGG